MASTHEVTRLLIERVKVGEEFTAKSVFNLIPDNQKRDITVSRIVAVIGYLTPEYFVLVSRGVYCITNRGSFKIKEYIKSNTRTIYRKNSLMEDVLAKVLKPNEHYLVEDIRLKVKAAGLKGSESGIRKALLKGMGVFIEKSTKHKHHYILSDEGEKYLSPVDFNSVSASDLDVNVIFDVLPKGNRISGGEILGLLRRNNIYFNQVSHVKLAVKALVDSGMVTLENGRYQKVSVSIVDKVKLSDFDKLLFCN
jgi:hypothetical protein